MYVYNTALPTVFPIKVQTPEFPNENLRQIGLRVHELWSDKQTDRHQNKDYNYIYRFV